MKRYKAILIDWDDTIGDFVHSAYRAQQDIFAKYNLSEFYPKFEDWFEAYHSHNLDLWERYGRGEVTKQFLQRDRFLYPVVHALGGGEMLFGSSALQNLADRMGKDFVALTNKYFVLLPDAEEVVRYLCAKYPLTIVSNGFGEVQHYKIEHSGLKDCFRYVALSEEVGINKPQPGIFLKALEWNGVSPEEAIMVGDSYRSDIAGAKAAGIDQLWIQSQDVVNHTNKTDLTATYIVPSLRDVMQIL